MRKWRRKEKLGVEEAMYEQIQMEEIWIEKCHRGFECRIWWVWKKKNNHSL